MKKKKILFIILTVLIFISAFVCTMLIGDNLSLTMIESEYIPVQNWWIPLIFVLALIIVMILAFIFKDKTSIALMFVFIVVLSSFSFVQKNNKKNYSRSIVYLQSIETTFNITFPSDSTIIIKKDCRKSQIEDNDINIVYEGVVRLANNEQFSQEIDNDLRWESVISDSIKNYVPQNFYNRVRALDKFIYALEDDDMMLLAYSYDEELIHVCKIKIV